ncbi:MAG: response regulator transcription factor [Candidatus Omnitrophota bacterium]|jgi:two-component system alkaline phosphatase synthesis response regulator PhoP
MKNQAKIIIVEDDKDISTLIAYNLRKEGFLVEQVFDGCGAVERLKKEYFDIAIVDIMLPGINGFDICREIKSENNPSGTFVIVVSAKHTLQDKLYAHIMGADCYFAKPFSVNILLDAVREIRALRDKEFTVKQK